MRERRNESEPLSPAATERQNLANGRSRRGGRDEECSDRKRAQGSRRRVERGKPPVSRPQLAEESDPAEWSRPGDESAEAA